MRWGGIKKTREGNSLVVQWLGLRASIAQGAWVTGSIPGWGTKIPQAKQCGKKKKKKKKIRDIVLVEVQKREPSCTAGGHVNWGNCYQKQYGGSSKN